MWKGGWWINLAAQWPGFAIIGLPLCHGPGLPQSCTGLQRVREWTRLTMVRFAHLSNSKNKKMHV
jgi:hypothetical protein